MHIDWGSAADWAAAISSSVVLILIWQQIRQVNTQIIQNDEQERFRRSWEFVRFYRDELRDYARRLEDIPFDALTADPDCDLYRKYIRYFYQPRVDLFILLNQLVQHQQVEERLLFGYLEYDFNRFVEIGVTTKGAQEFRRDTGAKLSILLAVWGTHIKSRQLLYGAQATG